MLVGIIILIIVAPSLMAQTPRGKAPINSSTTTVCEVLKNPAEWNGRLVAIRGVVDNVLRPESTCADPFVTEGHVWPQAIDVRDASEEDKAIDGKWMAEAFSYGDFIRSARSSKRYGPVKITAVFIGRLIAREKYTRVKTGYGSLGNGFGHLGAFPVQLAVYGVKDVKVSRLPEQ